MAGPEQLETMPIDEVIRRWPETIAVFRRHQMACVGCAVAPFFTIADAARIYELPAGQFAAELWEVIGPEGWQS